MKKQLLFLVMILLPMVASAHDIAVQNADGVTIYYNYINDGKELEVTSKDGYSGSYKGEVVIPEEVTYMNRTRKVTRIGEYTFYQCSSLSSITIPNSVTSIGNYAFKYCTDLTSVSIPNSVTIIGNNAFEICSSLTSITIPRLTSVTIPNSVTTISDGAFEGCSSLTSVTIPNSVTSIGLSAFSYCSSLTSVTIGNSVTSIGIYAFYNCSGLTSVTIPNSVTNIANFAFYRCSGLASVTIGNSVTSIGANAFEGADIPTIISLIENPFTITGKTLGGKTFSLNTFNNATLYVPKGTIDKYKATDGWKDFVFIEEGTGGGDTPPTPEKCEKPVISYENGRLIFSCETEDVEYHWSISPSTAASGTGSEVSFEPTAIVSVYASKDGYNNSDTTTMEIKGASSQGDVNGDVNGDGDVNITDVTYVIDIINQQ